MNEIDEAVPQLKFYEEVSGCCWSFGTVRGSEAEEGCPSSPRAGDAEKEGAVCQGACCSESFQLRSGMVDL